MNSIEMKTLIKIIIVCVALFLFSPLILGVVGFVFRGIMWIVLAIVITITLSIMYFKHKIKKETKEYYATHDKDQVKTDAYEASTEKVDIDYSDATIIDVEEFEESDEDK
ncbi:MAG: hypothetical protein RR636_13445 [Clostridium sp.]|uniref:hypothetical protein n=1 Tax=Clostridium sp. TaxID=1506 RepID=UPI0030292DAE